MDCECRTILPQACGISVSRPAAVSKGITIGSGQCPVMRYNRWLRDLIIRGQAKPSQIVSHELPLDEAVRA